jgi:hypothetical protein
MTPLNKDLTFTLESIFALAAEVCGSIDHFRPDVLIGLAHSGWMPVEVARALHGAVGLTPFPPAARVNVGSEKHDRYLERFGPSFPAFCCITCSDDPVRIGHYLAWVMGRKRWLADLSQIVEGVGVREPERILVVDDLQSGYRAGLTIHALLRACCPSAEVRMLTGATDLTNDFVDAWISTFAPTLAAEIERGVYKETGRYSHPWHERLKPLITGSEDLAPDRLVWQPLTAQSSAVTCLASYLPGEVALAAPAWAEQFALRYALDRLSGAIPDDAAPRKDAENHEIRVRSFEVEADNWRACDAWLARGVDLPEERPPEWVFDFYLAL